MANSTINGRYRMSYPFEVTDIKKDSMTAEEKQETVDRWNKNWEANNDYKKHRVAGKVTSSLNPTTGKRENVVRDISYDAIGEQLDKLWHDINNDKLDKTGEFYKVIKAVKDKYATG